AMPTSAIVALEGQVRVLGERLQALRATEVATAAMADIEQALAVVRDRIQVLTPAEELTELCHVVKLLSSKADSIAGENAQPEKIKQLEDAIGVLQGLASQIASRELIAALSQDIRALGDKIDHNVRPAADSEFATTLEQRLANIAEAVEQSRPI